MLAGGEALLAVTLPFCSYHQTRHRPAHCLWCSKAIPKGRRKYCSDECSETYYKDVIQALWWGPAAEKALERAKHRCETCGSNGKVHPEDLYKPAVYVGLEVHHIVPLDPGEKRHNSPKNRQENLKVLCRPCHERAHHPLAAIGVPAGQLPLFEWAGVTRTKGGEG